VRMLGQDPAAFYRDKRHTHLAETLLWVMATQRQRWTRDELLLAFNLYCRTPFGRLHHRNPDIIALVRAIGRTPGSVAMKLCNFASLDPAQQARGIRVHEFAHDWGALAAESEDARERLRLRFQTVEDAEPSTVLAGPTDVARTVRVWRVQGLFRATVLASYDFTCAISGINVPDVLVASHIIPWSREESRRLDPRNGIALSALHDRAFDRGLISVDENLALVVSRRLHVAHPTDIHRSALLDIEGRRLRLPSRFKPDPEALAWHRAHVFLA
jgi:putative restriction endonuclease